MSDNILSGSALTRKLISGVDQLTDMVKVTIGRESRNIAFDQKHDIPLILHQAQTIVEDLSIEDPYENMGLQMAKAAVLSVQKETGGGLAETAVLLQAMLHRGQALLASHANGILLRRGMLLAADAAADALQQMAVPVSAGDLERVIHGCEFYDSEDRALVLEAFRAVGPGGMVVVEDSQRSKSKLNHAGGIEVDAGIASHAMLSRGSRILQDPMIAFIDEKLTDFGQIRALIEEQRKMNADLLLVVREMKPELLGMLAVNVVRGVLNLAVVVCPGFGDTRRRNMEALAAMTGGAVMAPDCGWSFAKEGLSRCGRAESVTVDGKKTLIVGAPFAGSPAVQRMIRQMEHLMAEEKNDFELDRLQETLSLLKGSVAVIEAGGHTDNEMFERRFRLRAGVQSIYAALETGVVPCDGIAWLLAAEAAASLPGMLCDDISSGAKILLDALQAPACRILLNAGIDKKPSAQFVPQQLCAPLKTATAALRKAAELAATILTAETAVLTK